MKNWTLTGFFYGTYFLVMFGLHMTSKNVEGMTKPENFGFHQVSRASSPASEAYRLCDWNTWKKSKLSNHFLGVTHVRKQYASARRLTTLNNVDGVCFNCRTASPMIKYNKLHFISDSTTITLSVFNKQFFAPIFAVLITESQLWMSKTIVTAR